MMFNIRVMGLETMQNDENWGDHDIEIAPFHSIEGFLGNIPFHIHSISHIPHGWYSPIPFPEIPETEASYTLHFTAWLANFSAADFQRRTGITHTDETVQHRTGGKLGGRCWFDKEKLVDMDGYGGFRWIYAGLDEACNSAMPRNIVGNGSCSGFCLGCTVIMMVGRNVWCNGESFVNLLFWLDIWVYPNLGL